MSDLRDRDSPTVQAHGTDQRWGAPVCAGARSMAAPDAGAAKQGEGKPVQSLPPFALNLSKCACSAKAIREAFRARSWV